MGTYERRIQAPEKSLNADWVPEEGELFKNGANLYMGDNTTASNALTPINVGGVKRYVSLLTQIGTNAPTEVVLENSAGMSLAWAYSSPGFYEATVTGATLTFGKTHIMIGARNNISGAGEGVNNAAAGSEELLIISTVNTSFAGQNGNLVDTALTILIYP